MCTRPFAEEKGSGTHTVCTWSVILRILRVKACVDGVDSIPLCIEVTVGSVVQPGMGALGSWHLWS